MYKYVILSALLLCAAPERAAAARSNTGREAREVRALIERVNTAWQESHAPETRPFWDAAAYHTGNMEAYFRTGDERFRTYS